MGSPHLGGAPAISVVEQVCPTKRFRPVTSIMLRKYSFLAETFAIERANYLCKQILDDAEKLYRRTLLARHGTRRDARYRKHTSAKPPQCPGVRPYGPIRCITGNLVPICCGPFPTLRAPPIGGRCYAGMIGDPREIQRAQPLDEGYLRHNQECVKPTPSSWTLLGAENQTLWSTTTDWMKEFNFLDFIRDVGEAHHR